jgi:hypothetical protein
MPLTKPIKRPREPLLESTSCVALAVDEHRELPTFSLFWATLKDVKSVE